MMNLVEASSEFGKL